MVKMINVADEKRCYSSWQNSQWQSNTGCMVNINDEYVPEKNVSIMKWEYGE